MPLRHSATKVHKALLFGALNLVELGGLVPLWQKKTFRDEFNFKLSYSQIIALPHYRINTLANYRIITLSKYFSSKPCAATYALIFPFCKSDSIFISSFFISE